MENAINTNTPETNVLQLLLKHHAKPLLKEILKEVLSENELAIVSIKESSSAELISTDEAAKLLRVDRHTVYRYMKEGLPSYKIGKSHKFRPNDIKSFVNQRASKR